QLREELTLLRKDKIRLVNAGADKFLEKLESLGVSFIAFHPGAGHISIPLADMAQYMENPIAYAANRCLVSEEHYRQWLTHYQKPCCQWEFNDQSCGQRVARIDVPSQFVPGQHDRCEKHRSALGRSNVVSLRT
ncbi:MAG TPA: chromosome partitioning protein ParA, partial [Pseudomonadales bacterium]|nr:chromosome partitioning protein ParA [Pseudomonadales bacterium]